VGVARTVTPPALGREETAAWKYLALALIPSPLLSPEQGCQHALLKPAHFLALVPAVGMGHFGFLVLFGPGSDSEELCYSSQGRQGLCPALTCSLLPVVCAKPASPGVPRSVAKGGGCHWHRLVPVFGERGQHRALPKGVFLSFLAQTQAARAPARRTHMRAIYCGPWRHCMHVICWLPLRFPHARTLCVPAPAGILLRFSFAASLIPKICSSDEHQVAALTGMQSFAGDQTHQQLLCQPRGWAASPMGAGDRVLGLEELVWHIQPVFQCDRGQQLLQPAHFVPPRFSRRCQRCFSSL